MDYIKLYFLRPWRRKLGRSPPKAEQGVGLVPMKIGIPTSLLIFSIVHRENLSVETLQPRSKIELSSFIPLRGITDGRSPPKAEANGTKQRILLQKYRFPNGRFFVIVGVFL